MHRLKRPIQGASQIDMLLSNWILKVHFLGFWLHIATNPWEIATYQSLFL